MKKIYFLLAALVIFSVSQKMNAQTHLNVGGGYFGHTVTHPGVVIEIERERMFSENASLPIRLDVGFYVHSRNHTGLFIDLNYGFRRYFKSGLFLEESVGIGILQSFVHSDAVYQVDESGTVSEASRAYSPDFMPSLTLGIGYNLSKGSGTQNLIWLRPKISWQLPHKTTASFHPAMQLGFTHTIKTK
jgi:hypothetical protein